MKVLVAELKNKRKRRGSYEKGSIFPVPLKGGEKFNGSKERNNVVERETKDGRTITLEQDDMTKETFLSMREPRGGGGL